MVLQSGPDTPVWGWATPGERIKVCIDTIKDGTPRTETIAGSDGRWMVRFKNLPETAEPVTLTVTGATSTHTYTNVLIGEVWAGSGQSNMEWGVAGALQPQKEIAEADYPKIRLFKAPIVRVGQPRSDFVWEQEGQQLSGTVRGTRKPHDIVGQWVECSPQSIGPFSAVMYFFGREIHHKTGKPIGLIESAASGTHIEGWLPKEALYKDPSLKDLALNVEHTDRTYRQELPAKLDEFEAWTVAACRALHDGSVIPPAPKGFALKVEETDQFRTALSFKLNEFEMWIIGARKALKDGIAIPEIPAELPQYPGSVGGNYLFNGMIAPIIPYGIRGVLWYQGENNGGEGESYFIKQKALIETWRELWGRGDFPFYFVQLPQYDKANPEPAGGDGWSKFREAQRKTLTVPNTGMAVTIDVGEPNNIHPGNKQEVGQRLALWALRNDYGQNKVVSSGPIFKDMKIEGATIRISFGSPGSGLMIGQKTHLEQAREMQGAELKHFAIAGADKQWRWAKARIEGNTVVVSSPEVPMPVAVRYAYTNNPEGANLYNREGLPASPFRTDTW
jgi:sialate O-acetylesterase